MDPKEALKELERIQQQTFPPHVPIWLKLILFVRLHPARLAVLIARSQTLACALVSACAAPLFFGGGWIGR